MSSTVVLLTPMGRALLQGFADNIDQMVIPFPNETAAAIKQALATIDHYQKIAEGVPHLTTFTYRRENGLKATAATTAVVSCTSYMNSDARKVAVEACAKLGGHCAFDAVLGGKDGGE